VDDPQVDFLDEKEVIGLRLATNDQESDEDTRSINGFDLDD